MDFAICTIDNKKYKAHEFQKLEESELAYKRRFLQCQCGGSAFFRKASTSGQAACFGARPHKEGCDLAAQESETVTGALSDDEKEYFNSGKELVLDLNFGAQISRHIDDTDEDNLDNKSRAGHHSNKNGQAPAKSHRRLSTILKALMEDENYFNSSNLKIDLEGYSYSSKNLFKNFNELTNEYVDDILNNKPNTRRAIWGMISDAQLDKKTIESIWINTGGNDTVSILIDEKISKSFLERFKIKELEDLSGKYILAIGKLNKSKNNKIFLKLQNIAYVTVV
ncbi:hypothetical protein [Sulfurimonas sp. HSL3-2]|uniref:hypothetical protein n=1 Tax=Hydrocurvibacter mobilis TaxID=3131936 RepID=UPI0031F92573